MRWPIILIIVLTAQVGFAQQRKHPVPSHTLHRQGHGTVHRTQPRPPVTINREQRPINREHRPISRGQRQLQFSRGVRVQGSQAPGSFGSLDIEADNEFEEVSVAKEEEFSVADERSPANDRRQRLLLLQHVGIAQKLCGIGMQLAAQPPGSPRAAELAAQMKKHCVILKNVERQMQRHGMLR